MLGGKFNGPLNVFDWLILCRFMPPRSICPSGIRKKRGIPKETCNALQAWFKEHISNPYPNATERLMLAEQHGLTLGQVIFCFRKINWERKLLFDHTELPQSRLVPRASLLSLRKKLWERGWLQRHD